MIDIQQLIEYDKCAFLALNGSNSTFWDGFMWIYTSTIIWIPLAMTLLYVIIKNNKLKETLLILVMLALVIFLSDRISSGFFKPFFKRFRPTQDPEIMYLVDIVNGYRGGAYGFISSHAANSFGIFTFISLLLKRRVLTLSLLLWAILNSFSRIYLGVHYTGDILCGSILGCLCGYLIYLLYSYLSKHFNKKSIYKFSDKYTRSAYLISDVNILLSVLYLTFFIIIIVGIISFNYKLL